MNSRPRSEQLNSTHSTNKYSQMMLTEHENFYNNLDIAKRRAKEMLQMQSARQYQTERSKLLKTKHIKTGSNNSVAQFDTQSVKSINSLRNERRLEQEREVLIKNRIHFVTLEKQRNLKTTEWARRKYSRIVQQRTENLQMKSFIEKQRSVVEQENAFYVEQMKEKSRIEKMQRSGNISQWRQNYRATAQFVKEASKQNEKLIESARSSSYSLNRSKASSIKHMEKKQLEKKEQVDIRKRKEAVKNHKLKIHEELQKKAEYLKKNDNLFKRLVQSSRAVKEVSLQAQAELERLEAIINPRSARGRSMTTRRGPASVFITKE